jgi:hypothetical protein
MMRDPTTDRRQTMKTLDSYVIEPEAKRGPGRPKRYSVPPELRDALPAETWTRSGESQHGHLTVTWWQTQDRGMTALRGLWPGGRVEWQTRFSRQENGTWVGNGISPRDAWNLSLWVSSLPPSAPTEVTPPTNEQLVKLWADMQTTTMSDGPALPTDEQLDDPAEHVERFRESCRNFRLNFAQYQMEAERSLPGCRLCAVADHFVRWEHAGMGVELYAFPCWVWAATRYTGESRDHDSAADAIAEAIDLHAQSLMQRSA